MPAEPQQLETPAATAWSKLESRVEGVRTRHRAKFLGTGLCLGVAVFVAAFLGFSLADIFFKLSVGSRFFALISTAFAVVAVTYWFMVRPWLSLGGSLSVARSVEQKYPELEEQLSTSLEYGRNPELLSKTSSPALVGALMEHTARRAAPLDFARTISWKHLGVAVLLAFALGAGMAAYRGMNPRLFSTTFARFLQPGADIAPPTLTVIDNVLVSSVLDKSGKPVPASSEVEVPVESSATIEAQLDGRLPETATLSVLIDEKENRWEDRVMDSVGKGVYRATLRRLLDTTKYRIKGGDAESENFKIDVYRIPEITEFALRLEYPAYTGKGIETLAPNSGDVKALKGTIVHVDLKANTDLKNAKLTFKSGRAEGGAIVAADPRKAVLSFKVEKDDEYQINIANPKGHASSGSLFLVKALKDRMPKVSIKKPEKDLMAHRSQTVTVEIAADDDIGVREIGIFHSLDMDEKQVMIRKLEPPAISTTGKLVWELGNMGLKGGEVIAYYAYALDNDDVNTKQGKMTKSDIHFLTIYDEEEYEDSQNPDKKKQPPGTPPAVKQLDKLIDIQKKLLKDTFAQARQRDAAAGTPVTDIEKSSALKTMDGQAKLRAQVRELIEKVKEELEKADGQDDDAAAATGPKKSGMGEKELKHMEAAMEKMVVAEAELKVPEAVKAVRPETEALRHLSETRRLLLSDKEGDPRFKMAMDKQSKKKKQKEQDQQQQDQQQAKEELAEMPKMMEKEKQLERELEQLNERKKKNPPQGQPETAEQKKEKDEQRKLQREMQKELEQLAKDAEERARKLDQLAQRNPDMQPAADKMQAAADKLDQAAKEAKEQAEKNTREAEKKTAEAQKETKDSQRSLRNALEKQVRQEIANLQKDAQELAMRQQDLAQQARDVNQPQDKPEPGKPEQQSKPEAGKPDQQGKPEQGKPDQQGKPEQGKPDQQGKPEQGKPDQQGKPEQGKPDQQGKPEQGAPAGQPQPGQGQPQGGDPKQPQPGKPGQQGDPKSQPKPDSGQPQQAGTPEQKMKGMSGQQRDIQNELKELAERMNNLSQRAADKKLAGAESLEKAQKQASENSPAAQAAQKAQEALNAGKQEDAQREAAKAAKAMEQMASQLQDAAQKTMAGDMKELADAMKKLKSATKEQGDINKDLAQKRDPAQLGEREEKVAQAAKELADVSTKLEVMRQHGRDGPAKDKLEEAAKQAENAAQAMKGQDTNAAKAPAESAEKSLNQALAEMERAAGKTLEEKARDAKAVAKSARENQEKAAEAAKDIPKPGADQKIDKAGEEKRNEAADKQHRAARDAKRLEHTLEGLQEIAKEANPAAADAAREAREKTEQAELPKAMEELGKGIEQIGDPKKAAEQNKAKLTPKEASEKGEELAKAVKDIEKSLDNYIAEAVGSQLDRLRNMEQEARDAAKKAQELAQANPGEKPSDQKGEKPGEGKEPGKPSDQKGEKPGEGKEPGKPSDQKGDKPGEGKEPGKPSDQKGDKPGEGKQNGRPNENGKLSDEQKLAQLEKEMKRLQPKLERLEPGAPELQKMRTAMAELANAKEQKSQKPDPNGQPSKGGKMGGPAMERVNKQLDEVSAGLITRIERLLRAREVRPDEDEDAPKDYRVLVDRYYEALSKDVEVDEKL